MADGESKHPWLKPLLVVAVVAFGLYHGKEIPVTDQASIIEGVKNTAAILFGVVAAWIALVYPDELKRFLTPGSNHHHDPKTTRLFKAFYVASASLLLTILFPALIILPAPLIPKAVANEAGRVGLAMVLMAILLQIWALLLTLISTETLRLDALGFRKRAAKAARLLHRRRD